MPVKQKSPFVGEWEAVSNEGQMVLRELWLDDILPDIVDGLSVFEIMHKHESTREVTEHLICMIPYLMKWRDSMSKAPTQGERLPELPGM